MGGVSLYFVVLRSSSLRQYIAVALVSMLVVISLPFLAVGVMGREVVTFLASVPSIEAAETKGFYTGGPVEGNSYVWGNCTYWTYAMRLWAGHPISNYWGNANTWATNAKRDGYEVNQTPAVGAIYQTTEGYYGHVAYVIDVNREAGTWTISEMNNLGLNIVNHRTFSMESATRYNFIHGKKGDEKWNPSEITLPDQYTGLTSQTPQ